jgi:hypothetical protein
MYLHEMFYPECKPVTDISIFEKFMFKEETILIEEDPIITRLEEPIIEEPIIIEKEENIFTRLEKECIYSKGVQDGLFWSMYILQHGYNEYNRNKYNYGKIEVQEKEKIAEYLHKNGSQNISKQTNYKLTRGFCCEIESDLITNPKMTFSGLIGMCAFYKCNIVVVDLMKHIYYSFSSVVEEEEVETHILYKNPFYTGKINSNEYFVDIDHKIYSLLELKDHFLKIENFQKPMKSITNYKKIELEAIASKVIKEDIDKSLDKKQLYEKILLFISTEN